MGRRGFAPAPEAARWPNTDRGGTPGSQMKKITVPEEGIETLFGSYDENLKYLESIFEVRIRTQGHEILIDGDGPGPDSVDRVSSSSPA